jgi:hypothetical protein
VLTGGRLIAGDGEQVIHACLLAGGVGALPRCAA